MALIRPAAPPGHVLQVLDLPAGGKILAHVQVGFDQDFQSQGWLVVTNRGLGICQSDRPAHLGHTDWVEIERISLKRVAADIPKRGAPAWLTIYLIDQSPARRVLLPSSAKRVASLINERFEASIVTVDHLPVAEGRVRGALRRLHNNKLEVQVIVPADLDRQAPEVQAAVLQLADKLSEAAGGLSGTW